MNVECAVEVGPPRGSQATVRSPLYSSDRITLHTGTRFKKLPLVCGQWATGNGREALGTSGVGGGSEEDGIRSYLIFWGYSRS